MGKTAEFTQQPCRQPVSRRHLTLERQGSRLGSCYALARAPDSRCLAAEHLTTAAGLSPHAVQLADLLTQYEEQIAIGVLALLALSACWMLRHACCVCCARRAPDAHRDVRYKALGGAGTRVMLLFAWLQPATGIQVLPLMPSENVSSGLGSPSTATAKVPALRSSVSVSSESSVRPWTCF